MNPGLNFSLTPGFTPMNLIYMYAGLGFALLVLVLLSKSHKLMNCLSITHSCEYLGLTLYALLKIPVPYVWSSYFYIDHLSLYEALITAVSFLFASLYARGYVESLMETRELHRKNLKIFYAAFNLLLITATIAVFLDNLALFWIFTELTTVCAAVLVAILSARENIDAALKYIFIVSGAMLFAFIGLIFLFALSMQAPGTEGTLNWTLLVKNAAFFSPKLLSVSFVFIFIGFAAKSGVAPFHTWLPDAYKKAPSVSAILSGLMQNLGMYGLIRVYAIVRQTEAAAAISWLLIFFGVFSIVIAVFNMLSQKNLKCLIGFSSVEHMGLLLIGIGAGTKAALFWVLFYTLAHSFTKEALLFAAGILHRQYRSNRVERITEAFRLQPLASWTLVLSSAAILGLPPFPMFPAKLFILLEAARLSQPLVFVLLLLLVLAAASFGKFLIEALSRRTPEGREQAPSPALPENTLQPYVVRPGMKIPMVVMLGLVFSLGFFFPESLENLLNSIVYELGYI